MSDVGVGALLVRMVVSLAVVLALVFAAYAILRRRQGFSSGGLGSGRAVKSARRGSLLRSKSGSSSSKGRGLRVVGRIGVGRTASVVAVQFADRVFMLGASEQGPPTVLAELDLDAWNNATEPLEDLAPISRAVGGPLAEGGKRAGFVDALREATTRRG